MAAQETTTYRVEQTTRYALTECSHGKTRDLAHFYRREAAEKALHLAYRAAELGEQFGVTSIKLYNLVFVRVREDAPGDANGQQGGPSESFRILAVFSRLDDAEKARDALNANGNPILKALEAAFGPVTYGPPCAYANEEGRTNPYVSLRLGWKGEDAPEVRALLIERLVADINDRRTTGPVILRCDPYFSSYDGIVTVNARLTFAGGMDRTGDREGKGPVFIS